MRNESALSAPLITVGWNCQRQSSSVASLPAAQQRGRQEAGRGGAVDEVDRGRRARSRARSARAARRPTTKLVGSAWIAAMARPDRCREAGVRRERRRASTWWPGRKLVDDGAGAADRRLPDDTSDTSNGRRLRTPVRQGTQRDEVGGLLGLGAPACAGTRMIQSRPSRPVSSGGVEVAVPAPAPKRVPTARRGRRRPTVASAARVRWDLAMPSG